MNVHEFIQFEDFVLVRRAAPCNDATIEVGTILEPDSENPCLRLHIPYGFNGIEKLIEEFREWQFGNQSTTKKEYPFHFPLPGS